MSNYQINISKDNGIINSSQINGSINKETSVKEWENIINEIEKTLAELEKNSKLKKDDAEKIEDVITMTKEELVKSDPKIGRLRNCVTLIAPMITIANGFPILATNLQKLMEYITSHIQ